MTSPETARHNLYDQLEAVLGPEPAATLMTYLPQHSQDEAATKADVGRLEDRFDRLEDRFDRLEARIDRQSEKMDQHLRTFAIMTVSAMTGLTAIFAVLLTIVV